MKKNLFKLLSLLLALCLVLCACGTAASTSDDDDDDDDKKGKETTAATEPEPTAEELIIGTWEGELKVGEYLNGYLAEQEETAQFAQAMDFSSVKMDFTMEFTEDGEVILLADEDDMDAMVDDLVEIFMENLKPIMEAALASELEGMTLDQFLAASNMTFEQLLEATGLTEETVREMMTSSMGVVELNTTGEYSIEDGKLVIDGGACDLEVDETTLSIGTPDLEDMDEDAAAIAKIVFPMELKRVD